MRKPPSAVSSMRASGSRVMSTSCAGASICSFIRSTRFVPPATNLAAGSAADAQADAMSLARRRQRIQHPLLCQTLDGGDLVAVMHHRERQTAIDTLSVDDDRAGAALSLIAAFLRAGQRQMLAQCIEQRGARIKIDGVGPPVDREIDALDGKRSGLRRGLIH